MAAEERRARNALRIIAESVPIHLLHLDRDERILFANEAAAATWGLHADEMVGKTIAEVIGEAGRQGLKAFSERVLRGERVAYEASFDAPGGDKRFFLNTYEPVFEGGEITGFVATGTDITARKQVEDALAKTREREAEAVRRLEEEHALRARFITTLAHDVRGPLTAAKVSAQLAGRNATDPERVRRLTLRVSEALDRADAMIRDMLDASALERGHRLAIHPTPMDLVPFVAGLVEELASVHGDRIRVSVRGAVTANADADGLRRVIENLVGNAVKYGDAYAPITVKVAAVDEHAVVEVHNAGAPIPPDEQPVLFEPYRRARAAQDGQQKGWGLGLTLVKGLTEAHGGAVSVSSDATTGTTFRVALPLIPDVVSP